MGTGPGDSVTSSYGQVWTADAIAARYWGSPKLMD